MAASGLLAPLQFAALVVLVHIVEQLRKRRSVFAQVFNVAAYTVTGIVAQTAYRAVWPAPGELTADLAQPAGLAAGLAPPTISALLTPALPSLPPCLATRTSPPPH